jgi:hypothetical protein
MSRPNTARAGHENFEHEFMRWGNLGMHERRHRNGITAQTQYERADVIQTHNDEADLRQHRGCQETGNKRTTGRRGKVDRVRAGAQKKGAHTLTTLKRTGHTQRTAVGVVASDKQRESKRIIQRRQSSSEVRYESHRKDAGARGYEESKQASSQGWRKQSTKGASTESDADKVTGIEGETQKKPPKGLAEGRRHECEVGSLRRRTK